MNTDQPEAKSRMEEILESVDLNKPENLALNNRCAYIYLLYHELEALKGNVSQYIKSFNTRYPEGNPQRTEVMNSVMTPALRNDFKRLYEKMELSRIVADPSYPKRQVKGVDLEEVKSIDISVLGLNTVVSKEDPVPGEWPVLIKLEDIDEVRRSELTSVCALAKDNPEQLDIVRAYTLGMSAEPLFTKESAEVSVGV
jgi:hypothetical protein